MRCVAVLLMNDFEQNVSGANVNGIFDKFQCPGFPALIEVIPIFVRLVADKFEYGRAFTVRIDLVDEDGQTLAAKAQEYTVPDRHELHTVINVVADLPNIQIDGPGVFDVNVFVDDEFAGTHPFQVML